LNNFKKIALSGVIAITSFNGIAAPDIQDFDILKARETVHVQDTFQYEHSKENLSHLKHLNTGKQIPLTEVFKNEVAGVYEHPSKKGEILVLSFQDKEDLNQEHKETIKTLIEHDHYDMNSYVHHKNKEKNAIQNEEGSFHSPSFLQKGELDYNFISFSSSQVNEIIEDINNKGFSKKTADLMLEAIFYHELAHSHNHQSENVYEQINKLEQKGKSEDFIAKQKSLLSLGEENYADSFLLLKLAKLQKENGNNNSQNEFKEFAEYFYEHFRNDNSDQEHFDDHLTKYSVKVAIDFIEDNWEVIDQLSNIQLEQIAASITNGTLNHPSLNKHINSFEGQLNLSQNGGIQEDILQKISNNVNEKINDMIETRFDNNGNKEISFNYKPYAHKQQNRI